MISVALSAIRLLSKAQLIRMVGDELGPVAIRVRYGWSTDVIGRALGIGAEEADRRLGAVIERLTGVQAPRFEPKRARTAALDPRGIRVDVVEEFAEQASLRPIGGRYREFIGGNGRFDGFSVVRRGRRVA